ncbi:ABC transporter ATP-binding protein [Pseudobdellovibrio exovorus]|uniref:ABC-type daunorubicin resistance ATP-binding protein n=1 Tax=Pseudobdellovibrio exovorus JSS TaxID=1184267 RepID=M4VSQ2_9BACT|nr:ATP-binding cassette domain-containing protein [Pseudobdellovibrio exovorus]AGH96239.1 ABC-type daunorubicin resistance ATP-binding protein [Pseudobdellovibrio exovorus JSS]
MNYVIEAKNLGRVYKTYSKKEGIINSLKGFYNRQYTEKVALKNANLKIEAGKIVGLVGSNGAGKTTLLKMLSGLIYPSTGTATVLGYEPWKRESEFLKKVSILLGQKNQLWWDITPRDSYSLLTKIYDLNETQAKARVNELAHLLQCQDVLDTQLRRLSLGERMKMEIIGALLHSPKVLFLDEPTIGLDIVAQTTIRDFLELYVKEQQPAIILTSHYMDDIAQLADQLLLISQGEIVYDGNVDHFMQTTDMKKKLIYRLKHSNEENEIVFHAQQLPEVLKELASQGEVVDLKVEEVDFEDAIHRFLEAESGAR